MDAPLSRPLPANRAGVQAQPVTHAPAQPQVALSSWHSPWLSRRHNHGQNQLRAGRGRLGLTVVFAPARPRSEPAGGGRLALSVVV
ncbi:hypothetical protein Acy02nite_62620 [Actinoplanes cyaneus]|uniref:Uncharacterized protein n=1 Tax=Actinoplanes cyaneus TaxID=52696 RepID=A0A919IP88_9ACTN|nr:hypothetical protein Acy02nite_62620 [Actinoplanes cyaneus]